MKAYFKHTLFNGGSVRLDNDTTLYGLEVLFDIANKGRLEKFSLKEFIDSEDMYIEVEIGSVRIVERTDQFKEK